MKNSSTSDSPLLGAHMSIAGGVPTAIERGMRIGCRTIQMFVKNNNQWKGKPITDADALRFKELRAKSGISPIVVHDTYLINLCARDPEVLKKSREAFLDELRRCDLIGVEYLNLHPGSHMGEGEEEGIRRIAESINLVHEATPGCPVKSVLETTAGQGTSIGYKFEHLRRIIDLVEQKDRMAVCVDTCHIFAAGYDFRTEQGYEKTFKEFDDVLGLERLVAFHVNDSLREAGSKIDRHEHIGKGKIGSEGFRHLMNDRRFDAVPKILETDKSEDMHEDTENMAFLRSLIRSPHS